MEKKLSESSKLYIETFITENKQKFIDFFKSAEIRRMNVTPETLNYQLTEFIGKKWEESRKAFFKDIYKMYTDLDLKTGLVYFSIRRISVRYVEKPIIEFSLLKLDKVVRHDKENKFYDLDEVYRLVSNLIQKIFIDWTSGG